MVKWRTTLHSFGRAEFGADLRRGLAFGQTFGLTPNYISQTDGYATGLPRNVLLPMGVVGMSNQSGNSSRQGNAGARAGAAPGLSAAPATFAGRTATRATASALRANGREVDAQVVNVLNDLQTCNELARAALADGNTARLNKLAVAIIDNGHTLLTLTAS